MKTFIVADDNPVDRFLHAKIVSEAGFKVLDLADDGNMLVKKTKEVKPDFILSDIFMPNLDGISACKKVKEIFPNVNCICTTSFDEMSFPFQIKKINLRVI